MLWALTAQLLSTCLCTFVPRHGLQLPPACSSASVVVMPKHRSHDARRYQCLPKIYTLHVTHLPVDATLTLCDFLCDTV